MKYLKVRKRFYIPILFTLMVGYTIAAFSSNVEVYHVYKVCPVFVTYTDNLRYGVSATTKGLLIFIDPSLRDNKSTLNHELMHAEQAYRYCFQHWIPTLWSDHLITRMEAEAYALDISDKRSIPIWAKLIKEDYKSSVPIDQIEEYILYYWKKQRGL